MKLRTLVTLLAFLWPALVLADDAQLHGRWAMIVVGNDTTLEDLAEDFHYTFRPDGVLVTETPFAQYEGTWAVDAPGEITLLLMSAMPAASENTCAFAIDDDALHISDCGNGGPPSDFIRAE